MAPILRVKALWTGFNGAPGYSVFHFRDFTTGEDGFPADSEALAAAQKVTTFFDTFKGYIPRVASIRVESELELIEETTGQMIDIVSITAPAAVSGGALSATTYSAASGAVVNWRTQGVRNGRRVRGRTFIVPLAGDAYENNGTLASAALTQLRTAADALIAPGTSPDLGVWARPTSAGASDGNWFVANSAFVPDMAAVLRSRRD